MAKILPLSQFHQFLPHPPHPRLLKFVKTDLNVWIFLFHDNSFYNNRVLKIRCSCVSWFGSAGIPYCIKTKLYE